METENNLAVIAKESGLNEQSALVLINKFAGYFALAKEWKAKADSLVIDNVFQTKEIKLAKEGQLFLRSKRTAIEKARVELKEQPLAECKAIDNIAKMLTGLITPIEKDLEAKAKFIENKLAKEKEELRQKRQEQIKPYIAYTVQNIDLAALTISDFNNMLSEAKTAMENAIKAEQERKEAEIQRQKEQEEIRKENERLRKEKEEQDKLLREAKEREELAKEELRKEKERKEQTNAIQVEIPPTAQDNTITTATPDDIKKLKEFWFNLWDIEVPEMDSDEATVIANQIIKIRAKFCDAIMKRIKSIEDRNSSDFVTALDLVSSHLIG